MIFKSKVIKMNEKLYLPFNKFSNNVYSQSGEDGIINELLTRLNLFNNDNWCVEFGAWDGKKFSNTYNLVSKKNWNAIYIEGDKQRYKDLLLTCELNKKIIPINCFVEISSGSEYLLDNILKSTNIPVDFDILSIDVDGIDLDIWEGLNTYKPKIVLIEINSSILPGIIWRHTIKTPGSTFSAALNVAKHKNYTLVCHTGNLIFVRSDLIEDLYIDQKFILFPEKLFITDFIQPKKENLPIKHIIRPFVPEFLLKLRKYLKLKFSK